MNVNSSAAVEKLREAEIGDFIFRPSSRGPDNITLTWKFYTGNLVHIDIQEHSQATWCLDWYQASDWERGVVREPLGDRGALHLASEQIPFRLYVAPEVYPMCHTRGLGELPQTGEGCGSESHPIQVHGASRLPSALGPWVHPQNEPGQRVHQGKSLLIVIY
jgi:SH2 domain